MPTIQLHPSIERALRHGAPVVALETAVLTTGLPRTPFDHAGITALDEWDPTQPTNLQTVRRMGAAIRAHGAEPAVTALIDGTLHIGLDDDDLDRLALDVDATKAGASDLARLVAEGRNAGTTVSGTLIACHSTGIEPIRFFATGGIGGVHREWTTLPDISADLRQIAMTPTCVVCSGAKSILDLTATLETLEALGVPRLGYRTDMFPQFYALGSKELPVERVDDVKTVASICRMQWEDLLQSRGVLLANPVPEALALATDELESIIGNAEHAANQAGEVGRARTPFLLGAVADATTGRSMLANIALLENNAGLAAAAAVAWCSTR